MSAAEAPRRVHYAWIVAAVTFLVLLVTAGIRATPGVLMVPLESEFGWSRAVDLGGGGDQHRAVRPDRSVRRLGDGPVGPAPRDPRRAGAARRVGRADDADAAAVAADAALGRAGRHRHRRHLDGARRHRRHPLVRRAPRRWCSARCRRPTPPGSWSSCRCWPAWSSTSGWRSGGAAGVAAPPPSVFVDRAAVHARSPGGPRPAALRPAVPTRPRPRRRGRWRRWRRCASRCASRAFWVLAGTFFVCGASTNGLIGTHLIAACHDYGIPADAARRSCWR